MGVRPVNQVVAQHPRIVQERVVVECGMVLSKGRENDVTIPPIRNQNGLGFWRHSFARDAGRRFQFADLHQPEHDISAGRHYSVDHRGPSLVRHRKMVGASR